jgi:hypothetical protein
MKRLRVEVEGILAKNASRPAVVDGDQSTIGVTLEVGSSYKVAQELNLGIAQRGR